MIELIKGNTYNIKLSGHDLGNLKFNNTIYYGDHNSYSYLSFEGLLQIQLNEINLYEIKLVEESDYIDSWNLKTGGTYLIGAKKEIAKYYTVVGKYIDGYILMDEEKILSKRLKVSFVNYRVFKD
jgi:hypothetical protein